MDVITYALLRKIDFYKKFFYNIYIRWRKEVEPDVWFRWFV